MSFDDNSLIEKIRFKIERFNQVLVSTITGESKSILCVITGSTPKNYDGTFLPPKCVQLKKVKKAVAPTRVISYGSCP